MRKAMLVAIVVLSAAGAGDRAAATPGDTHVVQGLPHLTAIDLAPDGTIWATAPRAGRLVHIRTTTPEVEGFPVPTRLQGPQGLAIGDDGGIWFTTGPRSPDDLGRVDPETGDVISIAIPGGRVYGELAEDGDGHLWAAVNQNRLARIDVSDGVVEPATDVTFVNLPRPGTVGDIDVGRDGTVWFGAYAPNRSGYLGHVDGTDVEVHNAGSFGGSLAVAGGGNVWFTVGRDLVRLDPRSDTKRTFQGAADNVFGRIAFGPDGQLWRLDRVISRTDPATGDVDYYPSPGRGVSDLDAGSARLWGLVNGKLLRVQPGTSGETDHRDPVVILRTPVAEGHYRVDRGAPVEFACRAPGVGRLVDCFAARDPAVTDHLADGSTMGFPHGWGGPYPIGAYARDQAGNTADVRIRVFADPICFDRPARPIDGDYGTPATQGDDVFLVAFRAGQGEVHALGGDDRICSAGLIDGGPGFDRCQGTGYTDDTFVSCEVIVDP